MTNEEIEIKYLLNKYANNIRRITNELVQEISFFPVGDQNKVKNKIACFLANVDVLRNY